MEQIYTMNIEEIITNQDLNELSAYLATSKLSVPTHRRIMKMISKSSWDITEFKKCSDTLEWYFFNISLLRERDFSSSMSFIDNNLDYFTSWYRVDGTLCFLKRKGLTKGLVFSYAKKYVHDKSEFVCRFGYLLFFLLEMNETEILAIEPLLQDDDRYYVEMMEAWLICEMVARNNKTGFEILKRSKLRYNILGKAIQKCLDSYRIDDSLKANIKSLREEKKLN